MSGSSSRNKGHNFERKIARSLRELFPDTKRGFQTRGGTGEEPDVDGTPFFIECKKHKRCNIQKAYAQALGGASEEAARDRSRPRAPVAITQDDRGHILVTMNMADWKFLVGRAEGIYPKGPRTVSTKHGENEGNHNDR